MSWQSHMWAVVRHPDEPKVLLLRSDRLWGLPKVRIEGEVWAGQADEVVPAFERRLGARPWIYRPLRIAGDNARERIEGVFEIGMPLAWRPPANSRWVDRDGLRSLALTERFRVLIEDYLTELSREVFPASRSPWLMPGWLDHIRPWIEHQISVLGHEVVSLEQVKQWSISTVMKVTTDGPDFYFKVSKELPLFVNEALVTGRLAKRFPDYVVPPVTVEPHRAWMLFRAFEELIDESSPVDTHREVFARFGELQRASTGAVRELLMEGCLDRRLDILQSQIGPLLHDEAAVADLTPDERSRLRSLGHRFEELSQELAALPIPYSLVHSDFNLPNAARNRGGITFFDWTDACIAHPFIDLMSLRWETREADKKLITDAYLQGWSDFGSEHELRRALAIAEVLNPLHYAVSYQSLMANLEPIARQELDLTGDFLRQVLLAQGVLDG